MYSDMELSSRGRQGRAGEGLSRPPREACSDPHGRPVQTPTGGLSEGLEESDGHIVGGVVVTWAHVAGMETDGHDVWRVLSDGWAGSLSPSLHC